jgi:hypothetical protein
MLDLARRRPISTLSVAVMMPGARLALTLPRCKIMLPQRMGTIMRLKTLLKFALLAGAVAGASVTSSDSWAAKKMAMPPGACAFEKKFVTTGTTCSFACDQNNWCSVQTCQNGTLTKMPIGCYGSFCVTKC